jgi:hypothetical protein
MRVGYLRAARQLRVDESAEQRVAGLRTVFVDQAFEIMLGLDFVPCARNFLFLALQHAHVAKHCGGGDADMFDRLVRRTNEAADDQKRERLRELGDHVALAVIDELVDQLGGNLAQHGVIILDLSGPQKRFDQPAAFLMFSAFVIADRTFTRPAFLFEYLANLFSSGGIVDSAHLIDRVLGIEERRIAKQRADVFITRHCIGFGDLVPVNRCFLQQALIGMIGTLGDFRIQDRNRLSVFQLQHHNILSTIASFPRLRAHQNILEPSCQEMPPIFKAGAISFHMDYLRRHVMGRWAVLALAKQFR